MLKRVWLLTTSSFQIWGQAKASRMSAAIAYYTMLSLAPLLTIAIAIAGYLFNSEVAEKQIVEQVAFFTTDSVAQTVASLIKNATSERDARPKTGLIAGGISLVVLIYGASRVFYELRDTFNQIWNVQKSGLRSTIKGRFFGVAMVLLAGFLLLFAILLSTAVDSVNELIRQNYPEALSYLHLVDRGISFLLIPLALSLLFWLIPGTKIKWQDVWPAGMITALLIVASRYLIDLYLEFSTTSGVYGAASSLVVLLIWVYMLGLVVFYGASFSHAWANTFGSRRNQVRRLD